MKKKYIFLFLICFIITFLCGFFLCAVVGDEIWNYGFAYNISVGMIPYLDFNLVITPLYLYILSIFINLFGNYLYSMYILNSLLVTVIFILTYKKIGTKSYILYPFIFLVIQLGYNLFVLFLSFLIIMFCKSKIKSKDIILGFLVSLVFLTKQNIGIIFMLPLLIYAGSFNKILIRFICFCLPINFFLFYLNSVSALDDFLNYCFFGLFDFASHNIIYFLLFLWIPVVIFLAVRLIKSKFVDEECMYILCFQFLAYPLFDFSHFNICFVLFLYYVLERLDLINIKIVIYSVLSFVSVFYLNASLFTGFSYDSNSNSFLYGRLLGNNVNVGISRLENYIYSNASAFDNSYDDLFIFDDIAYLVKLDMNISITKYDLINNGNMGYKGEYEIIDSIDDRCLENKCMFILPTEDVGNQLNMSILNHVRDNYSVTESFDIFDIYVSGDTCE